VRKILIIALFLGLFSCESVNTPINKTDNLHKEVKPAKSYTTKFCKKNKKLWAKSFLGKQAPEFTVEGWVTEKPDFNDKFILIDFWGLHCPQCKKAIPELNKISKKYKDKLVVVGIASSTKNRIKAMKGHKINYYSAFDTMAKLKRKYKVKGIPHVVIVAPDNTVVWEGYPFLGEDRLTIEKVGDILNK